MEKKHFLCKLDIKSYNEDDEYYTFKAYASTFGNVDQGGDRIMPGAFQDTLEEIKNSGRNIPVLWQHDSTVPVGVYTLLKEDPTGLYVEAKLPKDDYIVKNHVYPQLKIKSVNSLSIGYLPIEWEYEKDDGSGERITNLKKIKLFEISLVTFPMNLEAKIMDVKSVVGFKDLPLASEDRSWDASAAKKRIRTFTHSEEGPSSSYKNAFLWYDKENSDNFGAYKLPIADVIDNSLKAVPRAIFAAAAALRGARGGVSIPDNEKTSIQHVLEQYYRKMGRESPFKENILVIGLEMFKSLSVEEFADALGGPSMLTEESTKALSMLLESNALKYIQQPDKKDQFDDEDRQKMHDILTILNKREN